ncbi:MAG TPA: DUF488 domain-containing protein [Segeticoccus sp.]|jgi:uncharacterized protein (DUF488 family)|nr:DUF488 domain-containing protein [Segeticoccus sp.]
MSEPLSSGAEPGAEPGGDAARGRPLLLTVGHGRLGRQELAELLRGAGVRLLVDVRRYPGSRGNPQVARAELQEWLPAEGVDYRWEERLGGRRRLTAEERSHSPDGWWRVEQFRAYAGWTRSVEFRTALLEVLDEAGRQRTAVMCSESVWWRCHRRLVADVATLAHGAEVRHLMHGGALPEHPVAEGARLTADGTVIWDGS